MKCGAAWETCDILVLDKKGYAIDIEVKLSKQDLWQGEAKKKKHQVYLDSCSPKITQTPNFFYVCVPTALVEEAKSWVGQGNPRYGVIEFCTNTYPWFGRGWEHGVCIRKQAKALHLRILAKWSTVLLRRLSSTVATMYQTRMETYDSKRKQSDV